MTGVDSLIASLQLFVKIIFHAILTFVHVIFILLIIVLTTLERILALALASIEYLPVVLRIRI